MEVNLTVYERNTAPDEMQAAASIYEKKFSVDFDSLIYFPRAILDTLHQSTGNPDTWSNCTTVASLTDSSILGEMKVLSQVANTQNSSEVDRQAYYQALTNIYHKLPHQPEEVITPGDTLCVGIEREGRILADALGWLSSTDSLRPNLKRIPFNGGLLVGLNGLLSTREYSRCVIVDGAIASGATIISVLEKLRARISSFYIFSVHSSAEGLRAIMRYSSEVGITSIVTVGHVTEGINAKFYAVDAADPTKVIVGDLGDTISGF